MNRPSLESSSVRHGVTIVGGLLALILVAGCGSSPGAPSDGGGAEESGHLLARPGQATDPLSPGQHSLQSTSGLLYVPAGYEPGTPTPLLVLFHGEGGSSQSWVGLLPLADTMGFAVVATDSKGLSWDLAEQSDFGPDIPALDSALDEAFSHVTVDPARIAVGGFSDGGSYALSVGITNGDLFPYVIAFSPGFALSPFPRGTPKMFVAHGIVDEVVPIQHVSGVLVPALRAGGYDVTYEQFQGGHEIPRDIAREALIWFLGG